MFAPYYTAENCILTSHLGNYLVLNQYVSKKVPRILPGGKNQSNYILFHVTD